MEVINQLSQFGLNPKNWRMESFASAKYVLFIHKANKDFKLLGELHKTMPEQTKIKRLEMKNLVEENSTNCSS